MYDCHSNFDLSHRKYTTWPLTFPSLSLNFSLYFLLVLIALQEFEVRMEKAFRKITRDSPYIGPFYSYHPFHRLVFFSFTIYNFLSRSLEQRTVVIRSTTMRLDRCLDALFIYAALLLYSFFLRFAEAPFLYGSFV